MSFYARKMLNRPGVSFGSQRSRQSRDNEGGNGDDNDHGDGGANAVRAGGISRFAHQQQRHHQQPQQQRHPRLAAAAAAAGFSQEEIFQESNVPIEGSIHAYHHEDDDDDGMHNFSQVTLSQLSDGPSVRSMRSHRSSQRSLGGAAARGGGGGGNAALGMEQRSVGKNKQSVSRGGGIASGGCVGSTSRIAGEQERYGGNRGGNNGSGRPTSLRGPRENHNGGGGVSGLKPPRQQQQQQTFQSRHGIGSSGGQEYRPSSRHQEQQRAMTTTMHHHEDNDDNTSLKSSQPLLSQYNNRPSSSNNRPNSSSRPTSNGSNRPSSSGRQQQQQKQISSFSQSRTTSSRPSSRGRDQDSRMMMHEHHDDDNSTIKSQPLLSPLPTSALPPMPPRRLDSSLKRQSMVGASGANAAIMSQRDQQLVQRGRQESAKSNQEQHQLPQFRTPSRLSNLPSLRDQTTQGTRSYSNRNQPSTTLAPKTSIHPPLSSSRRSSVGVRTASAISGTLASLPTPSRAFRSMTSLAVKTTASLAAGLTLTPFRKGRVRSTMLTGSSTLAGSMLGSSSATPRSTLGSSMLASSTLARSTLGSSLTTANQVQRVLPVGKMDCSHTPNAMQDTSTSARMLTAAPAVEHPTDQVMNSFSTMTGSRQLASSTDARELLVPPMEEDQSNSLPRLGDSAAAAAAAAVTHDQSSIPSSNPVEEPMVIANMMEQCGRPDTAVGAKNHHDDSAMELSKPHNDDAHESAMSKRTNFDEGPQKEESSMMKSNHQLPREENQTALSTTAMSTSSVKFTIYDHQDEDDDMSKTSGSTLDMHGKAEELIVATRELKHQHTLLEKAKQDFSDMNERARQEWKEEYTKLESLQSSMQIKFGTLQNSMNVFSTKIASSAHDHELTIRTLVNNSLNEVRQESSRAMESISNHHQEAQREQMMKVQQLPLEVRALVETEARKYMLEMMDGMVATAKSDFQEWADGAMSSRIISDESVVAGSYLEMVGEGRVDLATERRYNNAVGGDDANNSGGSVGVAGILEKGGERPDPTKMIQSEHSDGNDNYPKGKDASTSTGRLACNGSSEKENTKPGHIISGLSDSAITENRTPRRSAKPETLLVADRSVHSDGQDSPLRKNEEGGNNSSRTPLQNMSTSTPFSRKATPLQNNYAKNRLSVQSSTLSQHSMDLESELHNDFSVVKSPFSSRKAKQCHQKISNLTHADSTQQVLSQGATPIRNTKAKAKIAKKASLNEPKHKVKILKRSAPNESLRKNISGPPKHARVKVDDAPAEMPSKPKANIRVAPRKASAKDSTVVVKTPKTKRSNQMQKRGSGTGPSKKAVRKRSPAAMMNASKSPRRSKRLKEGNRVEQMAVQAADTKPKPTKVTPTEDATPNATFFRDDASDIHSTVICNSTLGSVVGKTDPPEETGSILEGYDSLLGTSVTVPTDDKREDELIGFDDNEDAQPDKRSLTSLLPFGGFRNRKGKTMSKKKSRKPSVFSFDFS
eukprot:CAMPEP_0172297870 /NCGR_PEP_ID=MMETSP1058-20130122/738_1 /TAXON_ID=83371 /ORGANISM="Detonula confervacea, Strain CCMP 353" /LENGTH=1485 /DNA_ID=CAMNT_0013007073 /DNA_START=73 /DNA_END=4530 /DNA_ORIENTATION=-